MPARSISIKQLRADCQLLERTLLGIQAISKQDVAAQRPGGPENGARDAQGHLAYYRYLQRTHAIATAGRSGAPSAGRQLADAEVIDALRSAPVPVTLVGAEPTDRPLYVYAKSFDALVQVHALDRQLAWMVEQHARLAEAKSAAALDHLPQVMEAISYTYQLLAWIVTTPGPGMPYPMDDDRPAPPAAIAALEPWDLVRIVEAHHKHLLRLHAIRQLLDERPATEEAGGLRPSWSAFWGAMELETGTSADSLMKHRALASVLAANRLGSGVRQAAMDAADVKRERGA